MVLLGVCILSVDPALYYRLGPSSILTLHISEQVIQLHIELGDSVADGRLGREYGFFDLPRSYPQVGPQYM